MTEPEWRTVEPVWDLEIIEERSWSGEVIIRQEIWRCQHANVEPVESGGEVVARLCTDCDEQLDPRWRR